MQIQSRKLKSVSMVYGHGQSVFVFYFDVFCFLFPQRKEFLFHRTRCFLGICFSHDCEKKQLDIILTTDFAEVIFREKKRVRGKVCNCGAHLIMKLG